MRRKEKGIRTGSVDLSYLVLCHTGLLLAPVVREKGEGSTALPKIVIYSYMTLHKILAKLLGYGTKEMTLQQKFDFLEMYIGDKYQSGFCKSLNIFMYSEYGCVTQAQFKKLFPELYSYRPRHAKKDDFWFRRDENGMRIRKLICREVLTKLQERYVEFITQVGRN